MKNKEQDPQIDVQKQIAHHANVSYMALQSAGIEEPLKTVAWKHLMRIFRMHRSIANALTKIVAHYDNPVYGGKETDE